VKSYAEHFRSYRHDVSDKARQYASGLMQAGARKNMDRMAEVVPDSKSRNLQQFLTHSKWDAREVIEHVGRDADELLGDDRQACLLIDESGFAKQGRGSVGVARQWLGRLGKVDNGQVAVFGVLAKGRFATPIDARLYLPEDWTNDPERCERAGIPEEERLFRTKPELALQIVRNARENHLRFGWVGTDAGYGKGPGFCYALDKMGETFMVDVHSDFHVYLKDPRPYIPEKTGTKGRPAIKYQTDQQSVEVQKIVNSLSKKHWRTLTLRNTTRGKLKVRCCQLRVYVWDGETDTAKYWQLVVTQSLGVNPDVKISLTNAPQRTTLSRLGWMQRQRYWVERIFEDGKSECGMADYQVRKWKAWHHHMVLVMMAMQFMLTERIHHEDTYPLLSSADIEQLLARFLPRRDVSKEEIIHQLEHRHRQRQIAIESHTRRQKIQLNQKQIVIKITKSN
jgi:SRSO17 transposase